MVHSFVSLPRFHCPELLFQRFWQVLQCKLHQEHMMSLANLNKKIRINCIYDFWLFFCLKTLPASPRLKTKLFELNAFHRRNLFLLKKSIVWQHICIFINFGIWNIWICTCFTEAEILVIFSIEAGRKQQQESGK